MLTSTTPSTLFREKRFCTRAALTFLGGLVFVAAVPGDAAAHGSHDEVIAELTRALAEHPDDAQLQMRLADANRRHGDWQFALIILDRVDQLAPDRYFTDLMRAEAWLAGEKPAEAKPVLDRFLAAHPESGLAWLYRARTLEKLGDPAGSLQDFREALAKTPHPEPDLIVEVADALTKQGEKAEAARVLATAIEQSGPAPALVLMALDLELATGQIDAALSRVEEMQKRAPRPEPWMAKRAVVLTQGGRRAEARAAWEALIAHLAALPNLERGSHAMSILAEQARQALAALGEPPAESAVPHAPAVQVTFVDPKALFPSRSVLGPGSNYEEELDRMDVLVLQQPANALFRFQRGELNFLDAKWKWAAEDAAEAERLAPGKFPVERLRGQILGGEGKLAEAKSVLDRYLASHSDDGVAYVARARIFARLQEAEAALTDYRTALARTPTPDTNLCLEVAQALLRQGLREEASQLLATALKVHVDESSLVAAALDLEVSMGNFAAALTRVEAIAKTSPQPEVWLARKAALLTQAGRPEEARGVWLGLRDRIAAMPNLQRGSPQMNALGEQARTALQALANVVAPAPENLSNLSTLSTASTTPDSVTPAR